MTRDVCLNFDEFGLRALEAYVRERRGSHSVAARTASLYYLADKDGQRATWPVPRFASDGQSEDRRTEAVPVELDVGTWEAVLREAKLQEVSAERLIEHAVLYFLADLDSGRMADRLDEVLGDGEPH